MTQSAPATMLAALFEGGDRISIAEKPVPVAGPGEALVRVIATALCGSDLKLWHKGAACTAGHEIVGRVEQPGHPLDGQRCAIYIPVHCGHCAACRRGDTQMCLEVSALIGWNRDGGYSEYLAVPDNCLLPIPDDIPDRLAPLLLDTIGTSAHAVRAAAALVPASEAPDVLVCGAGPVGLGAILALESLGYGKVFVSDPNAERLALAVEFGATAHPVDAVDRRFGIVVECSGAHAARNRAIEVILPRGAIMLVGENAAPWTIQEGPVFRRKDFIMMRTFYFPKGDLAANVELLRAGRERYARLVDAAFPIHELPGRFAAFAAGKLIKPVLAVAGRT
jgi:L-gulonate 5-dehydrogenase